MANQQISPDGKGLEKLISRIYQTLKENEEITISQDVKLYNSIGSKSQFDVLIKSSIAGLEIMVAIECKDYKKAVGISEIHDFEGRCGLVKGINKKVFVAVNGYQSGAIKAAKLYNIELYNLGEVSSDVVNSWLNIEKISGTNFESRRFNEIHFYTLDDQVIRCHKDDVDPQTPVIDPSEGPIALNELITAYAKNSELTKKHFDFVFEHFKKLPLNGDEQQVTVYYPVAIGLEGKPFIVGLGGKPIFVDAIEIITEYHFSVTSSTSYTTRSFTNNEDKSKALILTCRVGEYEIELIRNLQNGKTKLFAKELSGHIIEMIEDSN